MGGDKLADPIMARDVGDATPTHAGPGVRRRATTSTRSQVDIGIDGALLGARTGIGRYSDRLMSGLLAGPLGPRIKALTPPRGASRTLWLVGEVPALLHRQQIRLFHGVANFDLPLTKPRGVRYVLTVQDLIPLDWPRSVSLPFRLQFRAWLSRALTLADAVVCTSAAVAGQLIERFPHAPMPRIIPLAADASLAHPHVRFDDKHRLAPTAAGVESGGGALDRQLHRGRALPRYFLCLGSIESRKNVALLLRAFAAARPEATELWIAGRAAYGGAAVLRELDELRACGVPVRALGPVAPAQLASLVAGALALCAPSLAEGFGLPPLEALALGTPVLASDIPAHREVLGDAALLLAPSSDTDWTEALRRIASDDSLRAKLAAAGPGRAALFSWDRTVRETEALYRALL